MCPVSDLHVGTVFNIRYIGAQGDTARLLAQTAIHFKGGGGGGRHVNPFLFKQEKKLYTKRLGGPGRPVKGKSGQAGWPAGLSMPQASRTASEIVVLLAHSGPQNATEMIIP